jgi:hypothetical protein
MNGFRRQWLWPIALSLVTVFGLLAALTGEGGIWWALSWLMLAVPLLVIVLCLISARRSPPMN